MTARFWPLELGTYTLSSGFGPRVGGFHAGQDFAAADGTPIYACQAGTVLYIGPADGYGQWIVLDHSDAEGGGVTEYGHMWNAHATGLSVGDHVDAGQLIAYVGNNGQSTGPHLHLSVMPRGYDPAAKLDPLTWLTGAAYPRKTSGGPAMADQLQADVDLLSPNDGGPRNPRDCSLMIVHTNEGPATGSVEGLLTYLARRDVEASYTLVVGGDGRIGRSNDDGYIPWAAGSPANERGLHLCFLGRSAQTRAEWLSRPQQLAAGARILRDWSDRYGIPLTKLSGAQMRAGQSGVGGHADTVDAWRATDHTDPGPGFPWDVVLDLARGEAIPGKEPAMSDQALQLSQIHNQVGVSHTVRPAFQKVFYNIKDGVFWARAGLADMWNEIVWDGYIDPVDLVEGMDDPNVVPNSPKPARRGSLVTFVLRAYTEAAAARRNTEAILKLLQAGGR